MYTTKPLSLFKSQPEAAALPPPDGRNSGYIVVKGDEADGNDGETCCCDQCGGTRVLDLPFPQDRVLTLHYTEQEQEHHGQSSNTSTDSVFFVPVPDQPLASNRYYAVVATGKERGGLIGTCSSADGVKLSWFEPANVYQQIEVVQHERGQFTAKAVAADRFPPFLYRKKYWRVCASSKSKNHLDLGDAAGIDAALRSRQLADASLPTAMSTVVGTWYCPFYLIQEDGWTLSEQIDERGLFYEVSLEQHWQPVQEGSRMYSTRMILNIVTGGGRYVSRGAERERSASGFVGFRVAGGPAVAVCATFWERMLWEVCNGGWFDGEEDAWEGAGRSVLVERFLIKTMKGYVVVAFDFVHLNKVRGNTTSGEVPSSEPQETASSSSGSAGNVSEGRRMGKLLKAMKMRLFPAKS